MLTGWASGSAGNHASAASSKTISIKREEPRLDLNRDPTHPEYVDRTDVDSVLEYVVNHESERKS